jgi:hypothetical protein
LSGKSRYTTKEQATHLFVVAERKSVLLLHNELGRVDLLLLPDLRVLLVQRLGQNLDLIALTAIDIDGNPVSIS